MPSSHALSQDISFLDRLIATARRNAGQPALLHKRRGVWVVRRWADVLEEIDRLAGGLHHLGVSEGSRVAIDGEITARLLLSGAAIRAVGADIVSVPLSASPEELDRVVADPTISLVIGQGRETVEEWSEATRNRREVPIVFDHATPDSQPPRHGIVTLPLLKMLGKPFGWAKSVDRKPTDTKLPVTWVEESTEWADGLDIVLDHWVSSGEPLALPELLAAATRDRREIAPQRWIASGSRLHQNDAAIRERLPARKSLSGWLVGGALKGGAAPWFALTRALLRNRLGFRRLIAITAPAETSSPGLFGGLGLAFDNLGQPVQPARVVVSTPPKTYPRERLVAVAAAR
ncbi:AMP-binding protein [Aestuariivirga sp. YIM B02566]|uniref:AMP-binding protein n=1 Tax=Taklimakanibacter albus TaxID=2800327 RepID=A0ACC5R5L2_9HYPH|nr:AMP-binding protein [Aestuariivirga sp. YIM B02566]MBK1867907.1 AMP-binding protein [Aestuariivirga sp. YIM B02566]